ncbi:hypothetical protein HanIR_Chr13g0645991 [Helianthus annuus]|nr:hypothetical protein HanIR_Chr13g0645991 [Helianthus annuus]
MGLGTMLPPTTIGLFTIECIPRIADCYRYMYVCYRVKLQYSSMKKRRKTVEMAKIRGVHQIEYRIFELFE